MDKKRIEPDSNSHSTALVLADEGGAPVTNDNLLTDPTVGAVQGRGVASANASGRPPREIGMVMRAPPTDTPNAGFKSGPTAQPGGSAVSPNAPSDNAANSLLDSTSVRFAIGLWLAGILALYVAFFLQLEPAQWAGVTAVLVYLQAPRLNYAKLFFWGFGTIVGATFAVVLVACTNQDRALFLGGLTVWLSLCAYTASLLKSFYAFGAVLAGFTAAIVSLAAVEAPLQVFQLAVMRISCIFVGMASAATMIKLILPRHPHWQETIRNLEALTSEVLEHAAASLYVLRRGEPTSPWLKVSDHLSRLEHALAHATAESADSRTGASAARNIVARLLSLLAKSQSIEGSQSRGDGQATGELKALLRAAQSVLRSGATKDSHLRFSPETSLSAVELRLRELRHARTQESPSQLFLLLRLEEILIEIRALTEAWNSLERPRSHSVRARLTLHRDHALARVAALRTALAMAMAGFFWVAVGWPSGATFVLFTAVVSTVFSLQEDARAMGWRFLGSAFVCGLVAFIALFWLLQKGEGFLLLAITLGLFLVPVGYTFYTKPALRAGALPSMLLFFTLLAPSNQMAFNILSFLNNAASVFCASAFAYFTFFAITPPAAQGRCAEILRNVWEDLEDMKTSPRALSEQGWISLLCDRIRLLHRFGGPEHGFEHGRKAAVGLQLGLCKLRLEQLRRQPVRSKLRPAIRSAVKAIGRVATAPGEARRAVAEASAQMRRGGSVAEGAGEALAEMAETQYLLEELARKSYLYVH